MNRRITLAYRDVTNSFKNYRLWLYFGWADIKLRYKGSVLGPFWITLSTSIFIVAIGVVYSHLLNEPLSVYIPYLTSGLLVWNYISTVLTDSSDMFHNSKNFINHVRLPYLIFLYRLIWRNIIIFMHNFFVYFLVLFYLKNPVNLNFLFFIPGFLLLTFNLTLAGLLVGLIGTRFRDIPPVINSVLQIIFFVSPIAWMTKSLHVNSLFIKLNPVVYFLDIVRSPLLGQIPQNNSWEACIVISLLLLASVIPIYAVNRTRIPFWL